jgi:hypothetical protein
MRDARKFLVTSLALVAAVALVACGNGDSTAETGGDEAAVTGEFSLVAGAPAEDSQVAGEAELERPDGGTTVSVDVSGLESKTAYVAHLHTGGCDLADPGGPHFQFEKGGSEEPPNEIHLEFTTDASGKGEGEATSRREVPVGEAGSVVIHSADSHHEMTAYAPGDSETVFAHEGVDHSKGGGGHPGEPEHAAGDEIACAELEGAAASAGGASAAGDVPTIVVRDGEPVGGVQELEYNAGEEVRFRVTSDTAEEVHVHGYDLSQDVPAGGTVEFDFPAELEGIYEAELEELGVQIVELRINP